MRAGRIAEAIEAFAPLDLQESWDNSGFCIGNADSEVSSAVVGLDCTEELVAEALEVGADMVITHHPLIFGGVKRISMSDSTGRTVIEAVKNGITVYACHTNMDKVLGGVSGTAAAALGLQGVEVLDRDADGNGLGIVGTLPVPMHYRDFLSLVKSAMDVEALRFSEPVGKPLSRVALCGGSGSSLIQAAAAAGADAYVCGDVSYHHFYAPDGMMIVDIGHFESECKITDIICGIVREKFPNFAIHTGKRSENPVHYF